MSVYLDTSFLTKAYLFETESNEVARIITGLRGTGCISTLTDVEIASALHRKLPVQDVQKAYDDYREDRRQGIYQELTIDNDVFDLARTLAEKYAATFHLRSLDIIHLALALHHRCTGLATYDVHLGQAVIALGLQKFPVSS